MTRKIILGVMMVLMLFLAFSFVATPVMAVDQTAAVHMPPHPPPPNPPPPPPHSPVPPTPFPRPVPR